MSQENNESKTKWDLRQAKLELIGDLIQEKTLAYRQLIRNKSKENLRTFFYEFKVVFKEVKQFANKKNEKQINQVQEINKMIEDLDDKLEEKQGVEDFYDLDDNIKTFRQLDEADDKLRDLQMMVGLDIPLEVDREGYGQIEKEVKN